jgi:hypothetical protein
MEAATRQYLTKMAAEMAAEHRDYYSDESTLTTYVHVVPRWYTSCQRLGLVRRVSDHLRRPVRSEPSSGSVATGVLADQRTCPGWESNPHAPRGWRV